MIIADFYKKIYSQMVEMLKASEPVLVLGMCESGKNLSFRYTCKKLSADWDKKDELFFLDLVGKDAVSEKLHLRNGFSNKIVEIPLQDLHSYLVENFPRKKVILLINADELDKNNLAVMLNLVNLRTLRGTDFVYVIFGYINVYRQIQEEKRLAEMSARKVLRLLPLTGDNIQTMCKRNEQLFSVKLSAEQKLLIAEYSGGNPGLIKTLVMQAGRNKEWKKPDFEDELLQWRIKRLFFGLSDQQLSKLLNLSAFSEPDKDYKVLLDFGYLKKLNYKVQYFSPFLQDKTNLNGKIDPDIYLTEIESKILSIFKSKSGTVITREEIAELIWGKNFLHHYSDYALDKHISNLRKKLKNLDYPFDIKTLKGRGFLASK